MAECPCPDEYISSYWLSPTSTVPGKIVQFDYSFGYNCKRLFNLCLIDPDVLVFNSGNFIHFYRISTQEMTFRRSASGGGIGFILKNPNPKYNYLTIGENGVNPMVMISDFKQDKLVSILELGAQFLYTCAQYRPDGELLATQAGEPDYMITIWDWKINQVILRTKSFQNDVLCVVFSPYNSILITTSGLAHIKFWKMANTFTGLKLQGEIGRFGKTEISDIYAIYPMFDESVISSCDWGNMLVWEAGLIKIEVCRKNRKPCHTGPITLITMDEGEIMTAGMDGYVRIWFWETVELANPPDEDRFVEIEPIFEFFIGDRESFCEIRCLIKIEPDNKKHSGYYAQDGNGGIWLCDLDKDRTPKPPTKIFSCHGGPIIAADSSPISSHIATLGTDSCLNFYDYEKKSLMLSKKFVSPGTDLIWLPTTIDPSGLVILAAFRDGVIRQLVVKLNNMYKTAEQQIYLIDTIKAHTNAISKISINTNGTVLVSGSEDKTIFIHGIKYEHGKSNYVQIFSIGFVKMPSIPTAFTWKGETNTIAIACSMGEVIEFQDLPMQPGDVDLTYLITNIKMQKFDFKSIKSLIRQKLRIQAKIKRLEEKRKKKLEDLKRQKEQNPAIEIDENMQFIDSEEEEEEPPLFIPPVPNIIFWLQYTPAQTIWISVAGYDAGYIYEIQFGLKKPVRSTMVVDGDDIEIYSHLYIDKYLIYAQQGGMLRINVVKENYLDLTDYWIMGMHDNLNSRVSKIFTSHDGEYLFTVGYDGNIFSYKWNGPKIEKPRGSKSGTFIKPIIVDDIEDINALSIEEDKQLTVLKERIRLSNEHKDKILKIIAKFRIEFKEILRRNNTIVESQIFAPEELEIDPRITEDFKGFLKAKLNLVRRKLEFDVEKAALGKKKVLEYFLEPLENIQFSVQGIRSSYKVTAFKIHKLSKEIEDTKREIEERIKLLKPDTGALNLLEAQASLEMSIPAPPEETFFLGQESDLLIARFSRQMQRLLYRYRTRKLKEMQHYVDWEKLKYKKPDITKNHIDDEKAINEARETIGDYKLKTNPEFLPPPHENSLNKLKELLRAREKLFNLKNNFNQNLLKLREEKKDIYKFIAEQSVIMEHIHKIIPVKSRKVIPDFLPIDPDLEYPEENLKELAKPGTGIEIEDLFITKKPTIENKEILLDLPRNPLEDLEWQVLGVQEVVELPDYQTLLDMFSNPEELTIEEYEKHMSEADGKATHFELEMRYCLIIRKLMQQDFILRIIDDCVDEFEENLNNLNSTQLEIEKESKFLEIYLITLNQELIILKDCESLENVLITRAEKALFERNTFLNRIQEITRLSEDFKKNSEKWNEQIKTINNNFLNLIKGNKFYDFLRRIFKKKFRPPKDKGEDSETESESESSSSEEEEEEGGDEKSMESMELGPLRLDEDVCPPGCDSKLYDLAFVLRKDRQALEETIYIQNKLFEERNKEIIDMRLQLKEVENAYTEERSNLFEFRREKQQFLNQVETLIVMNMEQMQYLRSGESANAIENTLLFNSDMMLKLQKRVGQLEIDTLETKRIHRINIVHLQRMTTDCKFMHRQVNLLESQIKDAMTKKFGAVIDIDELEESVLRQYVFDLQTSMKDLRKEIIKKSAHKKEILAGLEKELCREMQNVNEKINILTVMQEEKNALSEVLIDQKKLMEKTIAGKMNRVDFRQDIKKLEDIEKHQQFQIETLEREIRTLKLKSKPLQVQIVDTPPDIEEDTYLKFEEFAQSQQKSDVVFRNLQLTALQFNPDVFTSERINKVVQKFLIHYFGNEMSENAIRNYAMKIGKYLGYIAKNFKGDDIDTMHCIYENLRSVLPKKLISIITIDRVKKLFKDVTEVFCYEKEDVNALEVITGIVTNAIETTLAMNKMNKTQEILLETFKEIIEVLTIDDIRDPKFLDTLCDLLHNCKDFDLRCINLVILVEDIMKHAKHNMIDEFTQYPVREAIENLIKRLESKIEVIQ